MISPQQDARSVEIIVARTVMTKVSSKNENFSTLDAYRKIIGNPLAQSLRPTIPYDIGYGVDNFKFCVFDDDGH